MKTELELEFKKETGFRPGFKMLYCPDCGESLSDSELYTVDYVDFLIDKIESLIKQLSEVSFDYKDEYEDAVYEIGQLQKQLDDAEYEIMELKNNQ